jgi:hypothetical protein
MSDVEKFWSAVAAKFGDNRNYDENGNLILSEGVSHE